MKLTEAVQEAMESTQPYRIRIFRPRGIEIEFSAMHSNIPLLLSIEDILADDWAMTLL